jgi:hypothetical protein
LESHRLVGKSTLASLNKTSVVTPTAKDERKKKTTDGGTTVRGPGGIASKPKVHLPAPLLSDIPDDLPDWVTSYFQWHREQREKFPDQQLLEHSKAPNLIIKYCKGERSNICGGLHDRLGDLPTSLYLANQTNRLLLFKWFIPKPLEHFLLPASLNWTVPHHDRFATGKFLRQNRLKPPKKAKHLTFLEWALEQNTTQKKVVVLFRHGQTYDLPVELRALGEADTIYDTPTFGKLWRGFFRPAPIVQEQLDLTMKSLRLSPGNYTATHCRVRHPGRYASLVAGKSDHEADSTGLPWQSPNKEQAIESAIHALQCTQWVAKSKVTNNGDGNDYDEPVYFYSDSEDLVQYLVEQKKLSSVQQVSQTRANETALDLLTRRMMEHTRFTARDVSEWPTVHLDRQLGLPPQAYVSTFVDVYMAAGARCIAFGVGNYGYLAAKISGTKCLVVHEGYNSKRQAQLWGKKTGDAPSCPI